MQHWSFNYLIQARDPFRDSSLVRAPTSTRKFTSLMCRHFYAQCECGFRSGGYYIEPMLPNNYLIKRDLSSTQFWKTEGLEWG